MANKTVYPYGTDGTLPSSIGIVNDTLTGGADRALSAEAGKDITQYEKNTVDISGGSVYNNIWIISGEWTTNSNAVCLIVNRTLFGNADQIEVNGIQYTRFAFLKSAVVVAGTTVDFCDGTDDISASNKTVTSFIPDDCNFIYFVKSYNSVDRLPTSVKGVLTVKEKVSELSNDVETLDKYNVALSISIPTGAVEKTYDGKWINAGEWQTKEQASVILLPVARLHGAKNIIVTGVSATQLAFLSSDDATVGEDADFCTGTTILSIGSNTVNLSVPDDCEYIYFVKSYNSVSRLPSSLTAFFTPAEYESKLNGLGEGYTLLSGDYRIRKILPDMTVDDGYCAVYPVTPCQKVIIRGAAKFVWLKTSVIQKGPSNNYEASDYFSGWCECDTDGAELFAAPDCHYLAVEGDVDVYSANEFKDFAKHDHDLFSTSVYMANLCVRYLYHQFVRNMYGGSYSGSLSGVATDSEFSYRTPSAFVAHITSVLESGHIDYGLIGTTRFALVNQCKRYIQALVTTHSSWTGYWQSSLAATNLGCAALRISDELGSSLYNSVVSVVCDEADILITKQPGTAWRNGGSYVFNLYWKNAAGTELVVGDSKSEEVGWYAACLGLAALMSPENENIDTYKSKFVEWCVISNAAPEDINSGLSINGYALSNLEGSNITDDGMVINHSIIHPDYMASRTSCLLVCVNAYVSAGTPVPSAVLFNVKKILHGFVDYEFTSEKYLGKYTVNPPYGAIIKDGAHNVYFPQGNDWGNARFNVPAGYLALMYSLGQSPRYDCIQSASILMEKYLALQDRYVTGAIISSSSENSYGNGNMYICNCGSAMGTPINIVSNLTHAVRWTDDDWFTIPQS